MIVNRVRRPDRVDVTALEYVFCTKSLEFSDTLAPREAMAAGERGAAMDGGL